jgi:hypothetical protein
MTGHDPEHLYPPATLKTKYLKPILILSSYFFLTFERLPSRKLLTVFCTYFFYPLSKLHVQPIAEPFHISLLDQF